MDDWDIGRDGLHITRIGVRRLCQLYSRFCGIGGGRHKKRTGCQCLVVGISSGGKYEKTGMKTFQEHLSSTWKAAESGTVTTNSARRETEDETNESLAAIVANIF